MPGPKMGPRPPDFDELIIRQSPTFQRWDDLAPGEKLKYACREFTKGRGDDEERLMRRIMIARRNNLRDHETLKKARKLRGATTRGSGTGGTKSAASVRRTTGGATHRNHHRSNTSSANTNAAAADLKREMDLQAVEATRSYQKWLKLPLGSEFVYNQRYMKGKEGDDWLLKKNIWRRMRYRRMNKQMVQTLKTSANTTASSSDTDPTLSSDLPAPTTLSAPSANTTSTNMDDMMMDSILHGSGMVDSTSSTVVNHSHHVLHSAGMGGGSTSTDPPTDSRHHSATVSSSAQQAAAAAAAAVADHFADAAAVEAAVAAAESFGKVNGSSSNDNHHSDDPLGSPDHFLSHHSLHGGGDGVSVSAGHGDADVSGSNRHHHHHAGGTTGLLVHDPLQAAAAQAALDAAARLAHISHPANGLDDDDDDEVARRFLLDDDDDEAIKL